MGNGARGLDTTLSVPHEPETGQFRALPPVMRVFVPAVAALGAGLLAVGLMRIPDASLPLLLGLLAASAVTSAVKLPLPLTTGGSTLSLAYVVNFIALLCLDAFTAVPIAVTRAWMQCTFGVRRRNPPHQTLFSILVQWLPFHETAHQTENVILWVRGDLFPDTKPRTTP